MGEENWNSDKLIGNRKSVRPDCLKKKSQEWTEKGNVVSCGAE